MISRGPIRSYKWAVVILIGILATGGFSQIQAVYPPPNGGYAQQATQPAPTFGSVIGGSGASSGATAAATGPVFTPTPLPTLRSDLMGIQIYCNLQQDLWAGVVDRAQFMGFKWIKCQLSWKELEPNSKGTYSPQLEAIRQNIVYAGRRGFKILMSVAKAPSWARPANGRTLDGPPANPQDLADFVNAVLNLRDVGMYINAFEIWNEPNTINEWTGMPLNGSTYMKYFTAAYQVIRAKVATMPVITAGLAPAGDGSGSVDDRKWIQQLYSAGLPTNDPNLFVGAHPYGWVNPPEAQCCTSPSQGWDNNKMFFFLDTIKDYHQIMAQSNHAQGQIWVTEFGWATFKGLHAGSHVNGPAALPPADPGLAWMNILTEDQQATYAVRAYQIAQSGDLAAYVGPMFLWNLNFATLPGYLDSTKPSLPEAGFSVLDQDWNTRPIYNLIQSAPKS